jgi:hypothetical protein
MRAAVFTLVMLWGSCSFAQGITSLDKAVAKQNWKKVFRLISNEINGTKLPQEQYNEVFDSLISNFKSYDCVVDAEWSKCGMKILIYPGQETIAINFKTSTGEIEKTFLLQTAKYRTHVRLFCLRIRIPSIEKKELVTVLMRGPAETSAIGSLRNVCVIVAEQEKERFHNAKVYFQARIIGGQEERAFPPLNFNYDNSQVKIEFSATNNTDDSLKIYWPASVAMANPLFRISFHASKPTLNAYEDTLVYVNKYDVITLKPKETVKVLQFMNSKKSHQDGNEHFFDQQHLKELQNHPAKEGTVSISYSAVHNDLLWNEDEVWKPAGGLYLFHLASYTITN